MIKKLAYLLALVFIPALSHAAFVPVRYVQISTNTLSRQTGTAVVDGINVSTITASTATITQLQVSTVTASSATISNLNGLTSINGGSPVTIVSSNTWTGQQIVSSGTVLTVIISTPNWRVPEGTNFQGERCAREVQYTVTASSSSTTAVFIPSNLSGAVQVHSASSYVKVRIQSHYNLSANNISGSFTIFRSSANVLGSNGQLQAVSSAGGNLLGPVSLLYDDSPATIGNIFYAFAFQDSAASGTVSVGGSNYTSVLTLQECF